MLVPAPACSQSPSSSPSLSLSFGLHPQAIKATRLQRRWRARRETTESGAGALRVDDNLGKFVERLQRFELPPARMRDLTGHCEFCNVSWDAAHGDKNDVTHR